VLSHVAPLADSGIFTMSFANASIMLMIGKYGMRSFQVSDIKEQYSFAEYKRSRVITSIAMMIVSAIILVFLALNSEYTIRKAAIVILMCVFKLCDSLEDVYHSYFQQQNRLDIAGKALTIRLFLTTFIFAILLFSTHDLLISLSITTVVTFVIYIILLKSSLRYFKVPLGSIKETSRNKANVIVLLKACTPLFVGTLLSMYLVNAPRYAIDAQFSDDVQACYGFLAMPVLVIALLSSFIYYPALNKTSRLWHESNVHGFLKIIRKQLLYILLISVAWVVAGYLLGIPVLSALFNMNLSTYLLELIIMLCAGGFVGVSGYLIIILTIVRDQTGVAIGYIIISILSFISAPIVVGKYAIMGAAILLLALMLGLSLVFALMVIINIRRKKEIFK
jgi:O-antigen/teichoic acid export membrane protein